MPAWTTSLQSAVWTTTTADTSWNCYQTLSTQSTTQPTLQPTWSTLIYSPWYLGTRATPPRAADEAWEAWNRSLEIYVADHQVADHQVADQQRRVVARARSLFESVLTLEQKAELAAHGHIHVVGSRGRLYRIRCSGQSGNVDLVDQRKRVIGRFCAHPRDGLPDADAWLAQMLSLQNDEDAFLRIANLHAGAYPADLGRAA